MTEKMFDYFLRVGVLPTHVSLESLEELADRERARRSLFTDKLQLPPRVFDGARLLELGPETGENALVFALWGAECTLSEPNTNAHPVIRDYFRDFGLDERLAALEAWDVEGFPEPEEPFDVVDAEGFIYSVQPSSLWIEKLARLLREDGFAVLFYIETFGSLLELTWRATQARFRALTGLGAVESARRLFGPKWDTIPHKRGLDAWAIDLLENPFVRLRYFLEAQSLCAQMSDAGFRLYSSWPRYDDGLDVHWFKREVGPAEQLARQRESIARNRLSHVFGRKHFLVRPDPELESGLLKLLAGVDSLLDEFDEARIAECDAQLARLEGVLASDAVLSSPEDLEESLRTVASLRRLLELLATGSADEIANFLNRDSALLRSWGMPSHFAVFRKAGPG